MTDYLWDRTGAVDSEMVRLEESLAVFAFEPGPVPVPKHRWREQFGTIAAVLLLCAVAWTLIPYAQQPRTSNWTVAEGVKAGSHVYIGGRIDTRSSPVVLESDEIGRVELNPGSDARLIESTPGRVRFDLRRGRLHALIWAPPGGFMVDTPSARAIDLGCQYDMTVDTAGNGFITVQTGWVAFQFRGEESFIPAGAACRTTRTGGPGVPFLTDAPEPFRAALVQWEQERDTASLATILATARPTDALTLWHLMTRVPSADRSSVLDRFAQLVPLPDSIDRAKVIANDRASLDQCWNALNLDDADWWREWRHDWRQ